MKRRHIGRLVQETVVVGSLFWWLHTVSSIGRFPAGDGPHIIGTSGRLAQQIHDLDIGWFIRCFSSLLGPHPPFAYLPFTFSEFFFQGQDWSHLFAGGLVVWLIWDGLRRCRAGLIGFLWVIAGAPIWLQAENAGIDLLAAAAVIQSLSHLYASNRLASRWHSWCWGGWIGVAFMTKYTAPMFLWGPCILAGFWAIQRGRFRRIVTGIVGFAIVAIPWWSTHARQVYGYVLASSNANSGLLTNKAIIDTPWYATENLLWYPAAMADAIGWNALYCVVLFVFLPVARSSLKAICVSAAVGGWLMLNGQSQRQDRYIIPIYPLFAATVAHHPLSLLTIPLLWPTLRETVRIYTAPEKSPVQRNYTHQYEQAGLTWPTPSESYWPISQDPEPWGIDEALRKVRTYVGSDYGTVGFLLDERGGGPGYGLILCRATALGYRWHIATAMIVQNRGNGPRQKNQPLASIFVGPFLLGEWPSRDFEVLLSLVDDKDPQRNRWLQTLNMNVVEEWDLPQGRTAKIWIKDK